MPRRPQAFTDASVRALARFRTYWRSSERGSRQVVYFETFSAEVIYNYRNMERVVFTRVVIGPGGNISIDPREWVDENEVHIGFEPLYQDFSLDANHALRIEGNSGKMGGAYTVTLRPDENPN